MVAFTDLDISLWRSTEKNANEDKGNARNDVDCQTIFYDRKITHVTNWNMLS